jgi:acyl-CoA thioester hydrolase
MMSADHAGFGPAGAGGRWLAVAVAGGGGSGQVAALAVRGGGSNGYSRRRGQAVSKHHTLAGPFTMSRQPPGKRADYHWFNAISTRWMDNDVFAHVNNVNYFSYFDTAVTYYEMTEKVVGLLDGPVHCVVAEVACRYYASLAFPDRATVGIRVAAIGRSSVRYEIGVFRNDEDIASAEGHFVHVFVERGVQKPVAIPPEARAKLELIAAPG